MQIFSGDLSQKTQYRHIQFTLKSASRFISIATKLMRTPDLLLYSPQHLWTKPLADGVWEAGITDYAQDLLGDIVFVDAPATGNHLNAGQACGLIESVKTGSDLHAPASGIVVEVNQTLSNTPELINDDPYKAWIFRYKPEETNLEEQLLSADTYSALIDKL